MEGLLAVIFILIAVCVYFIPSQIAHKRSHKNKVVITVINVFLVAFDDAAVLLWFVLLIWASRAKSEIKV
jgi:hypothetical protein